MSNLLTVDHKRKQDCNFLPRYLGTSLWTAKPKLVPCIRSMGLISLTLLLTSSLACTAKDQDDGMERRTLLARAYSGAPSQEAVHKLASLNLSQQLMLSIAQRPEAAEENRTAAIQELVSTRSSAAGDGISELLVPQESLNMRKVAGKALIDLPCSEYCVHRVLFYLYRVDNGEYGVTSSSKELMQEEALLNTRLYDVLRRNTEQTLAVLKREYGIGYGDPSIFGLRFVKESQFTAACPLLLSSEVLGKKMELFGVHSAEQTFEVIQFLNCRRNE